MNLPELKTGDAFFLMHHDNVISRVIAWFMGSQWSHSGLVFEVTPNEVYLIETSDFEVKIGLLDGYLKDKYVSMEIIRLDIEDSRRLLIKKHSKNLLGKLYGYFQLLSFGLKLSLKRVGIKFNNVVRSGIICCEVIEVPYSLACVHGFDMDPYSLDTQEVYVKLVKSGEIIFRKERSDGKQPDTK